jgi:hypothetical protein
MLQPGSAARVGPTTITFPVRQGRIWTTGQLCSINSVDSPTVELVANMPEFNLGFDLIYDVSFTNVTYNDTNQALAPFGFTAPTDNTPVCITDPALPRVPYHPPIQQSWFPGWTPSYSGNVSPISKGRDWRAKAG